MSGIFREMDTTTVNDIEMAVFVIKAYQQNPQPSAKEIAERLQTVLDWDVTPKDIKKAKLGLLKTFGLKPGF